MLWLLLLFIVVVLCLNVVFNLHCVLLFAIMIEERLAFTILKFYDSFIVYMSCYTHSFLNGIRVFHFYWVTSTLQLGIRALVATSGLYWFAIEQQSFNLP